MASRKSASVLDSRIAVAAHQLTVRFTDEVDLPTRFRRQKNATGKQRKINEESDIEKCFRNKVDSWANLIETMLSKIDQSQAWRFLHLSPQIDGKITKLTQNKDFCDLINYLILRRDTDKCESEELGGLALLSVAFQKEIERQF
jgi:hypothetical protein